MRQRFGDKPTNVNLKRRAYYAAYIKSRRWYARRERWEREAVEVAGGAQLSCLGCGAPWTARRGDLHHLTYNRIGNEAYDDLIPLCRGCHALLHSVMDRLPKSGKTPVHQRDLVAKMRSWRTY
ncbi:hypothetical protein HMPREF0578_1870 [Mobiluncus mulieris 28-1]|uniref:hypothetical protein n=1 Tax=Mobiluncus mulieris TaxID=2052 RepID=UPI0001BE7EE4|nr:hypothetical protein [Mobiluncus mulieris]EEZ90869.1 hypothetical protein HMPREF0578_1870 [Mobiluncus mulieris 28-1]MCU9971143.1 hypothetical protein [Mobiluncus mulieris]NMW90751.1 hypothetical protein [Mobiluncus mulieris]